MDELMLLALILPFAGKLRKPATAVAFLYAFLLTLVRQHLIASFFFGLCLILIWLSDWSVYKYPLFFLAMFDLIGILQSSNLLELFIYFELAIYASYFLIFGKEHLKAVIRYFIVNSVGSAFMLFAIAVNFYQTGSLTLLGQGPLMFFVLGLLIKLGIAPFQDWLVEIYQTVKLSGRLFFAIVLTEISPLALLLVVQDQSVPLQVFSMVSMLIANLLLLSEGNMLRILALFDASNLAYDLLAIGVASPASRTAALFMMFSHVLAMLFAFLAVEASKSRKLSELAAPKGMVIPFYAAFFALSGLPPFHLFPSKLLLFSSVFVSSKPVSYFLILNMLLGALAAMRIFASIKGTRQVKVDRKVKILLYLVLIVSVILGLFPQKFFELVSSQMSFFVR
ncbi:MAG: hypothetical protein GOU99_02540 [Candidatus Altiarchaeota archaeon]|nr:hypothetical protein [Candidatus Altiarchaeota archaeon]